MRVSPRAGSRWPRPDAAVDRRSRPPAKAFTSPIAAPGPVAKGRVPFTSPHAYFTRNGLSLVAGRAALVPAGECAAETARNAARAGATAVLIYGARLPAGGVPLDEDTAGTRRLDSQPPWRRGSFARSRPDAMRLRSFGVAARAREPRRPVGRAFSSTGLAYDGRVKPDIVAPGVGNRDDGPGPIGIPSADTDGERVERIGCGRRGSGRGPCRGATAARAHPLCAACSRGPLAAPSTRYRRRRRARSRWGLRPRLSSRRVRQRSPSETPLRPVAALAGRTVVRNVSSRPLRVRVIVRRHAEGAALRPRILRP